jgi:hypothetical protein
VTYGGYGRDEPTRQPLRQPVQPAQPAFGDTESILEQLLEMAVNAPNVPLSSNPRIDREQLVGLLQDALACLPDEIRQARWMLKERTDFMAKTQRDADEIIEAARVQADRMVQRTEIVRDAEIRSSEIIEAAEADARRVKNETEDFLDQRLASFEILLDSLVQVVAKGRSRLSIPDAQEPESPRPRVARRPEPRGGSPRGAAPRRTERIGHLPASDDSGSPFFDQDDPSLG